LKIQKDAKLNDYYIILPYSSSKDFTGKLV